MLRDRQESCIEAIGQEKGIRTRTPSVSRSIRQSPTVNTAGGYGALVESHVYNLSKKSVSGAAGRATRKIATMGPAAYFIASFHHCPVRIESRVLSSSLYNSFRSIINASQDDGVMLTVNTITVQKLRPRRQLTELRAVNN